MMASGMSKFAYTFCTSSLSSILSMSLSMEEAFDSSSRTVLRSRPGDQPAGGLEDVGEDTYFYRLGFH